MIYLICGKSYTGEMNVFGAFRDFRVAEYKELSSQGELKKYVFWIRKKMRLNKILTFS